MSPSHLLPFSHPTLSWVELSSLCSLSFIRGLHSHSPKSGRLRCILDTAQVERKAPRPYYHKYLETNTVQGVTGGSKLASPGYKSPQQPDPFPHHSKREPASPGSSGSHNNRSSITLISQNFVQSSSSILLGKSTTSPFAGHHHPSSSPSTLFPTAVAPHSVQRNYLLGCHAHLLYISRSPLSPTVTGPHPHTHALAFPHLLRPSAPKSSLRASHTLSQLRTFPEVI